MPIRITGMNSGLDTESIITELVKAQKTKTENIKKKARSLIALCVGVYLSSRAVTSQVLSAQASLTAVFGMGTGGPSAFEALTLVHLQGFEPGTH